jgi:hypothetical protein
MRVPGASAAVVVGLLILSGCGGAALRQQELNDRYSSFVGKPVSEAVLKFGPPNTQFDVGPTERAFQWQLHGTRQTVGAATAIYGTVYFKPGDVEKLPRARGEVSPHGPLSQGGHERGNERDADGAKHASAAAAG